jgi:hypothetical protein
VRRAWSETPFFDNCTSRPSDDVADRGIEIETILARMRLLDVVAGPVDDVSGSISIAHDAAECFPDFSQVWRALGQKIQSRLRVVARCGDRLREFVSQ